MRSKKNKINYKIKNRIFAVAMIAIVIACIVGYMYAFSFNDTEYTITVTDKERIYTGSGDKSSSKYLVFGDDKYGGDSLVFENTDCLLRGKWDSSNIQGQLKEGNTYKITVIGYRVSFFSMYQNIIKVEEIE